MVKKRKTEEEEEEEEEEEPKQKEEGKKMEEKQIYRAKELGTNRLNVADWIEFKELVGQEIQIESAVLAEGQFGEYVLFAFKFPPQDVLFGTTTGAKVVVNKLKNAILDKKFPIAAKVIKYAVKSRPGTQGYDIE
jgi:hypothetical protein